MSHDPKTYDNFKRCSARVASREWRLNDHGVIEDMVRQVRIDGEWSLFLGSPRGFMEFPVRRVIWVPRK